MKWPCQVRRAKGELPGNFINPFSVQNMCTIHIYRDYDLPMCEVVVAQRAGMHPCVPQRGQRDTFRHQVPTNGMELGVDVSVSQEFSLLKICISRFVFFCPHFFLKTSIIQYLVVQFE